MIGNLRARAIGLTLGMILGGCGGTAEPTSNAQETAAKVHRYSELVDCAAVESQISIGHQEVATSEPRLREENRRQAALHERTQHAFQDLAQAITNEAIHSRDRVLKETLLPRDVVVDVMESAQRLQQNGGYGQARIDALRGRATACERLLPPQRP